METFVKIPEIKLYVKMSDMNYNKWYRITSSMDCYQVLRENCFFDDEMYKESFYAILLNRANRVIGYSKISEGGVAGTIADPKIIFSIALNCGASAIIVSHNHPSGNLTPSKADKDLTAKLKSAGEFLDIPVLDHLIVSCNSYYSFADEGMM